jgi:hypothetical protein
MKNFEEIYAKAREAANIAAASAPDHMWPCGFAWVRIRPRNNTPEGPHLRSAVESFRNMNVGSKDSYEGGYRLSTHDYTSYNGQNMDVKEVAARAFIKVFDEAGITGFYVQTRID